jgi:ABC-type uncharacterized transport system involved in gliding motility auxiliary subunit
MENRWADQALPPPRSRKRKQGELDAQSQFGDVKGPVKKTAKKSAKNFEVAKKMPKASRGGGGEGSSGNNNIPAILCLDVEVVSDGTYWQFSQLGAVLSRAGQTYTFGAQVK